jgi:hypothetical protein
LPHPFSTVLLPISSKTRLSSVRYGKTLQDFLE